jgi:hypothetical protein
LNLPHCPQIPVVGPAADKPTAELSEGENGINEHGLGGTLHNPDLTIYLVVYIHIVDSVDESEMSLSQFLILPRYCKSKMFPIYGWKRRVGEC